MAKWEPASEEELARRVSAPKDAPKPASKPATKKATKKTEE